MTEKQKKEQEERENLLWKQSKEILRLGELYGLLDGTVCTSREEAVLANNDFVEEFSVC